MPPQIKTARENRQTLTIKGTQNKGFVKKSTLKLDKIIKIKKENITLAKENIALVKENLTLASPKSSTYIKDLDIDLD